MAVSFLASIGRKRPVPIFVLVGDGGRETARRLRCEPSLQWVSSPRHADILFVVGTLPQTHYEAARHVHDQLSEPRTAVLAANNGNTAAFPHAITADGDRDLATQLREIHDALCTGQRASTPLIGPRDNPVKWQGVGPHGQGGEGMMGGKPYGRAMAKTASDIRDGLQLDRVTLTLGPFLQWMPAGLVLQVQFQGDVIQSLKTEPSAFRHADLPAVFRRALREPVAVAELEVARAKQHLLAVADLLAVVGVTDVANRIWRTVPDVQRHSLDALKSLSQRLRRYKTLYLATRKIGVLKESPLAGMGPNARAAGICDDARTQDPSYQRLGFAPITHAAGDAEARWKQRLAEAIQSLQLASEAGAHLREPGAPLEGPRGTIGASRRQHSLAFLEESAVGQGWDEFVTTLVSLDLDVADFAAQASQRNAADAPTHSRHEAQGSVEQFGGAGQYRDSGTRTGAQPCQR